MSLFSRLLRLGSDKVNRLEDFHTEIVAGVLRDSRDFTVRWLAQLGVTEAQKPDDLQITTQREFAVIEKEDGRGDRPDFTIEISRGGDKEIVFIESKIGSQEGKAKNGKTQLQRYAEQLAKREEPNLTKRSLVYITRDFDPKNHPGNKDKVSFHPSRWHEFYRFLKKQEPIPRGLIKHLIAFMEANNMSQSNQFTALDILALCNFQKAQKKMDDTMWESVSRRFKEVCGGVTGRKEAVKEWARDNRYYMSVAHGEGGQLCILLGFSMPTEDATAYPEVFVAIEVNPKASRNADIVKSMLDFKRSKNGSWEGSAQESESGDWGNIIRKKSLQEFLSAEDHVQKVTHFFMSALDDVAEFPKRYPKLPWTVQPTKEGA